MGSCERPCRPFSVPISRNIIGEELGGQRTSAWLPIVRALAHHATQDARVA
jgi:hypothetical protein